MKTSFGKKVFVVVVLGLMFFWVWLFFSGKGLLISSEEADGTLATTLECTYFTGLGTAKKSYLKSDLDAIGKQVCPRLTDVD